MIVINLQELDREVKDMNKHKSPMYHQQVRAESVNSDCVMLFLSIYCAFLKPLCCIVILHNSFSDKAEYDKVPSTTDEEDPETLLTEDTQDPNVPLADKSRGCKLCT